VCVCVFFFFFSFLGFLCFGRKTLQRGSRGGEPAARVAGGKTWRASVFYHSLRPDLHCSATL